MNSIDLPTRVAPVDAPASTSPLLAVLRVRGADAIAFLDSQLTRNVPPSGTASPAGYCSPKGRLLATFVIWREVVAGADAENAVGLLVPTDLAESIAKRLKMYVMRAKATIELVGDDTVVEGVIAATDASLPVVWGVDHADGSTRIRYPDADGRIRFARIGPAPAAGAGVDDATWRWLDIRAGLPSITTATQDRFVPQMVNLEALGGVDFRKGCFPGQEVVARSQYLGKLKRRTALAAVAGDAVPAAGVDVLSAASPDPIGLVVAAARGPDGRIAALIELPVALFDATDLHVGGADGATIALEPLPYVLPDNEVFVRPKL
jgi:folate-binding protein YgfZ